MTKDLKQRSLWLVGLLTIVMGALDGRIAEAQVDDADCFLGSCGGSKGIPKCPQGYGEVGLVLYANSKADALENCETVISCTNLGKRTVEVNCRFYHGFNPIVNDDRRDAFCNSGSETPNIAPGDTTECATDVTQVSLSLAGGIFRAGNAECEPFEGKGLICVKGGKARDVFCQAHLVCGDGNGTATVLEKIDVVQRQRSRKNDVDSSD